jgi:hypothetical protein
MLAAKLCSSRGNTSSAPISSDEDWSLGVLRTGMPLLASIHCAVYSSGWTVEVLRVESGGPWEPIVVITIKEMV